MVVNNTKLPDRFVSHKVCEFDISASMQTNLVPFLVTHNYLEAEELARIRYETLQIKGSAVVARIESRAARFRWGDMSAH